MKLEFITTISSNLFKFKKYFNEEEREKWDTLTIEQANQIVQNEKMKTLRMMRKLKNFGK